MQERRPQCQSNRVGEAKLPQEGSIFGTPRPKLCSNLMRLGNRKPAEHLTYIMRDMVKFKRKTTSMPSSCTNQAFRLRNIGIKGKPALLLYTKKRMTKFGTG